MALNYQGSDGANDIYFDDEGRLVTLPKVSMPEAPSPVPDIPLPSPSEMTMPAEDLSQEMTMEPVDLRTPPPPSFIQTPSATPVTQAPVVPPPTGPKPAEQVQSAPAVSGQAPQPPAQAPAEPQMLREPPPTPTPFEVPKALRGNPLKDPYKAVDASVDMAVDTANDQTRLDTWKFKQEDQANLQGSIRQAQVAQQRMETKDRWLRTRQDYLGKYDRLTDEYINTAIDPDRWIKGKSKWERLILALGAGLGAADKYDPVGDLIDKKVQEDVALQKEALERKKTGAAMVQNSWTMAGSMMTDEDSRFELATAMETAKVGRELLQIAAATRDPQARITMEKNGNEALEKARAIKYDIADRQAQRAETRRHNQAGEANDRARLDLQRAQIAAETEANRAKAQAEAQGRAVMDGGQELGVARYGQEDAVRTRDRVNAYKNYRRTLAKIGKLLQERDSTYGGPGSKRWKSEGKTKLEKLRGDAGFQLAKMRDPGKSTDADVRLAMDDIPDYDTWTTSKNPKTALDTLVGQADDQINGFLEDSLIGFDRKSSPTEYFKTYGLGEDDYKPESTNEMLQRSFVPGFSTPERARLFLAGTKDDKMKEQHPDQYMELRGKQPPEVRELIPALGDREQSVDRGGEKYTVIIRYDDSGIAHRSVVTGPFDKAKYDEARAEADRERDEANARLRGSVVGD